MARERAASDNVMKPGIFQFLSLLLALSAWPIGLSAQEAPMTFSHLDGPLYLVEDQNFVKTNYLVYVGLSSVTVVGATWTPDTAQLLANKIKQVTDRPVREVIDTSPDPEWSGGNAYWKRVGAKVEAEKVTCEIPASRWDTMVENMRKSFPSYPQIPLSAPTTCHAGNFDLEQGDIEVFYLGPSHTAADVFVYFPRQQVLDAGSILKEQLGNLASADLEEYPKTLHKLQVMHLAIKTVISGHYSPVHGPDLIDKYLSLLEQNEQKLSQH